MALIWEPTSPWHWLASLAAAAAVLALLVRWRTCGREQRTRLGVIGLSASAALGLVVAAWNPVLMSTPDPGSVHLAVAVDVSDSVLRAEGGWEAIHQAALARISELENNLPNEIAAQGTASVVTFRTGSNTPVRQSPLDELPQAFGRLNPSDFAAGDGTDIAEGLRRAGQQVDRAGGRGAILLISDGNQTQGNAGAEALRLARRGIPIHVYPVAGQRPAIAITAANLPNQIHAHAQTFLRGLVFDGDASPVAAHLSIQQNPGLAATAPLTSGLSITVPLQLEAGEFGRLRVPLQFQGVGLQFVDLTLTPADGRGSHRRRFFTHVTQPPRIVAIGGDNRWTAAIAEGEAEIREMSAAAFSATPDLADADAVVISAVPAGDFSAPALLSIAQAVQTSGLGLMVMNGDHGDADEETPTVLMSYNDTPIEPLLPVSSRPRPFQPEPPARHIVMLIDASGSMEGYKIAKAQEVANYIIRNLLRPQDFLDVLVFTTDAIHLVDEMRMNEEGKKTAMARISGIAAGGGTDPTQALALIGARKLSNCGLIYLSDGEFNTVTYRPDCRATAFVIGYDTVPPGSPLWELADPFPAPANFNPASITIPYFEPEERNKFFEPGAFTPLSTEQLGAHVDPLPMPGIPLSGSAVSYVKEDADLIAVRPKLTDPILAYKENGAGYVGAFTTAPTDEWLASEEGRRAIAAWVRRVLPYSAIDRYVFQLSDHGDRIEMRVALAIQDGRLPNVSRLSAEVETEAGNEDSVSLRPVEGAPGAFVGFLPKPGAGLAQRATLVVREAGPDALARPQRIPLYLPPIDDVQDVPTAESYSFGLNEALLRALAGSGGGVYNPDQSASIFHAPTAAEEKRALWPVLAIIAAFCYLGAIALRRFEF